MSRREYRVRWQREGLVPRTAIYQTERGARAKVEALLWSDDMAARTPEDSDDHWERSFARMPPLTAPPQIETRAVDEWA